jgi:tetratricopeptide (TPR) repeat protein
MGNSQFQCEARLGLALAHLYQGKLAAARELLEAARQYDVPLINHNVVAVLGVVALRQGDRVTAQDAFVAAVSAADSLLQRSAHYYTALEAKALALCGLAVSKDAQQVVAAIEAYRAARTITRDKGVIGRALRLFDTLTQSDPAGILKRVRAAAAGE